MRKLLLTVILILCAACVCITASAEETAKNDISSCKVTASSGTNTLKKLTDGSLNTLFKPSKGGEQYVELNVDGRNIQGVYIKWRKPNYNWQLCIDSGNGFETYQRGSGFVQEYVEIPDGAAKVRILTSNNEANPLEIAELEAYSKGVLPSNVHIWNPTPSNAELLVVATHGFDEYLCFGGLIPYYNTERKIDTVIAFMAYDSSLRIHETMEGLWLCGVRNQPVFYCHKEYYCNTLYQAKRIWDEEAVTKELSKLIVTRRPQVVVTNSASGEFENGQRMMTAGCVANALSNAADEHWVTVNCEGYEPHKVQKCYMHQYGKKQYAMKWGSLKVESLGTDSLSAAKKAFKVYKSQESKRFSVKESGKCDCRKFGLYLTRVGEDEKKNDFFENVTLRFEDSTPANTAGFEKAANFDRLYTTGTGDALAYARYGTADGKTGWFAADRTGSLKLPAQEISAAAEEPEEEGGEEGVEGEDTAEEEFSESDFEEMSETDEDTPFEAYTDEEEVKEPHRAPEKGEEGMPVQDALKLLVYVLAGFAALGIAATFVLRQIRK